MIAQTGGVPVEQDRGFAPPCGPDPSLMGLRDELIPYFPAECRTELSRAPVGTTYCQEVNGFAAPVPGGGGAVVCLDLFLKAVLSHNNLCIHGFDPERVRRAGSETTVYAYAAAQDLHLIHALLGRSSQPMFPRLQRNPEMAIRQATLAGIAQMRFIMAHEYAHIALGHVHRKASERFGDVIKAEELEADELAAQVLLSYELAQPKPLAQDQLERYLGAIYAVFAAADAILDVRHMGQPFTRVYPSAEDRFDQVIEVFRTQFGPDLMAADAHVRPFGMISTVYRLVPTDPREAVAWLSEIALECHKLGDDGEERFVLTVARETAKMGGEFVLALQIDAFLAGTA